MNWRIEQETARGKWLSPLSDGGPLVVSTDSITSHLADGQFRWSIDGVEELDGKLVIYVVGMGPNVTNAPRRRFVQP